MNIISSFAAGTTLYTQMEEAACLCVAPVRKCRTTVGTRTKIDGLGHSLSLPCPQLSQGAKEQLLLALRAAVALELSKEEPQILILDDVLVNTDPVRQERVLDYLQQISTDVQILVLTCHSSMCRGVGHAVGHNVGVTS